jgi:hypothetical protein
MEQEQQNENIKVYYDRRTMPLWPESKRVERLFIDKGDNGESYRVTVKPVADWFVLKGKVDSRRTHDIVVSMVQTNHPYRELIDHVTIDSPMDA